MLLLGQARCVRQMCGKAKDSFGYKKKSPFLFKNPYTAKYEVQPKKSIKKQEQVVSKRESLEIDKKKFRIQNPNDQKKKEEESLFSILPQSDSAANPLALTGHLTWSKGNKKEKIPLSLIRSRMLKRQFRDYLKDKYNILPFLATPQLINTFLKELKEEDIRFLKNWFEQRLGEGEEELGQLEQSYFDQKDFLQLEPFVLCYLSFLLDNHLSHLQFSKKMRNLTDLDSPHLWYRACRKLKRKLIYHAGQTNSGKTYAAFQRLIQAETGVYLAPLRLLAWEGQQKMEGEGVVCNLITGQEKVIAEASKATHESMTIESLSLEKYFDVAVIDEVQLIGERERGGAWTKAVLGVQSKEVHVCGDHRAIPLLRHFCELTGDTLEVIEHHRLSKLSVEQGHLFDLKADLQEGDCLISFSSKTLYNLRDDINKLGGGENSCGIIYGKLPPETRKMQAQRFNLRQDGIKYMVATDAIGLGLNLTINRIIFWDMVKQGLDERGRKVFKLLDPFSVRQIAGRAGRYLNDGLVLARNKDQQVYTQQSLVDPPQVQIGAAIFPSWEQISQFVESVQEKSDDVTFYQAFSLLQQNITTGSRLFLQGDESMIKIAYLLRERKIDTYLVYTLCQAPVDLNCLRKTASGFSMGTPSASLLHFQRYVDQLLKYNKIGLYPGLNSRRSYQRRLHHKAHLAYFQDLYQQLSLYQWLYYKFSHACQDIDACLLRLEQCGRIIDEILHKNR